MIGLIIPMIGILVGILLNNDLVKGFSALFFILWACVLGIIYALKYWVDTEPLPLADLRKVESVEKYSEEELKELYYKETGRIVSSTMYLLMLPDEKHYVDWLELQATKFHKLKE